MAVTGDPAIRFHFTPSHPPYPIPPPPASGSQLGLAHTSQALCSSRHHHMTATCYSPLCPAPAPNHQHPPSVFFFLKGGGGWRLWHAPSRTPYTRRPSLQPLGSPRGGGCHVSQEAHHETTMHRSLAEHLLHPFPSFFSLSLTLCLPLTHIISISLSICLSVPLSHPRSAPPIDWAWWRYAECHVDAPNNVSLTC